MWNITWVMLFLCTALVTGDAQRPCSCSGVFRRTADCSHRDRSSFGAQDLCTGRTTKVDLSHNSFSTFPTALGAYVTHVNISHNQLTALPRAPPLNAKTHTLDVSFNQIEQASDELSPLAALHVLAVTDNRLRSLSFLPASCALRRLSAQRNVLQELPAALSRCDQLRTLDLSGNPLGELRPGVFSTLGKLEHLHLARAQLKKLDVGSFEGLEKLKHLDLAHNRLSALPAGVFSPLRELKELYLDNNTISTLSMDAFRGLSKLELLRITKNNLTVLTQQVLFSPLKNLKFLLLNDNQLGFLSSDVFAGLDKVDTIGLSQNRLESLPGRLFAGLRTLRHVALAENDLKEVPSDLLSGMETLHLLDLSKNHLSALPDGLFHGVNTVKVLNLSRNRFASFGARSLSGLERVERLDLQHNLFTAVPAYDASWPAVGRAFLGGNRIEEAAEATLRAWLGRGDRRRALALGDRPPLAALDQLRWALRDAKVMAAVRGGCACGILKRGYAEVSFCTTAQCPGATDDWIEAVRASGPSSVQG